MAKFAVPNLVILNSAGKNEFVIFFTRLSNYRDAPQGLPDFGVASS